MDQAWERVGKKSITKQAMYLAAARGELPCIRLGKRILILREPFEAWLRGEKPAGAA
jgi:hypothetical protein